MVKSILDYDSLVDYYVDNKVKDLSLVKNIAIKQDVSFSYEWFIHKHMRIEAPESFNFSTYTCLIQAFPEYYGNYIEVMVEDIKIPTEVIEKILQYIRSGVIPYNIWIDKVIADLKNTEYYSKYSIPGMLFVYLMKTMRCSIIGYMKLHKALLDADISESINEVVNAAYAMFLELPKEWKDAYMKLFSSEDETTRRKYHDNELSLFAETIIDMTQYPLNMQMLLDLESGKLPAGSIFWDEPMFKPNAPMNRSRLVLDTDKFHEDGTPVNLSNGIGNFREIFDDNDSMSLISDLVNNTEKEPESEPEFIVEKVALQGSNRVMSTNKFGSKVEAENFIEDVVNAVPDILNSFKFNINGKPYVLQRDR